MSGRVGTRMLLPSAARSSSHSCFTKEKTLAIMPSTRPMNSVLVCSLSSMSTWVNSKRCLPVPPRSPCSRRTFGDMTYIFWNPPLRSESCLCSIMLFVRWRR